MKPARPGHAAVPRPALTFIAAFTGTLAASALPAAPRAYAEYTLVPGFPPEQKTAAGIPLGTGFAALSPWGQYTAYLIDTNARRQRTWRIEHNLPNPGRGTAQGSTIYLLEGSARALLIDTGNPAEAEDGKNDLKSVVRHLLAHESDGRPRSRPLDFVVANTHSHGDHTGENRRFADRTVYYMDLDWPRDAPANYVPVRENGGATANGSGMAVGQIDLGRRRLKAIAVPPHTAGSIAWLDAENAMLFTGDALGSAWPFVQWGPLTTYAQTARHVAEVTRTVPNVVLLPAHYYQLAAFGRNGHPLDRQYVLDQQALAEDLLSGIAVGEPTPFAATHDAYWAGKGSARIVYGLTTLAAPGETLPASYHAVRLPGSFRPEWYRGADQALNRIGGIASELYLIHEDGGRTAFLVCGSESALLIGGGWVRAGLAPLVRRLAGARPLDVALLDGGITPAMAAELAPRRLYAAPASGVAGAQPLADGQSLTLGANAIGKPVSLRAETFRGPVSSLGLILEGDRILFAGTAFGRQGDPAGLAVANPAAFQNSLTDWMQRTAGRYERLYLAGNHQWYVSPFYLDFMQQALDRLQNPAATAGVEILPGGSRRATVNADPAGTATITAPDRP